MKKLKVKYARLPLTRTTADYVVQIEEPIQWLPMVINVKGFPPMTDVEDLALHMLDHWHETTEEGLDGLTPDQKLELNHLIIDGIEMVECDLLVEKATK